MVQPSILLVEDNPGDQRLTIEALRNAGVMELPAIVVDGVEALRYLEESAHGKVARPDLVILDLNLPRKGGRELLASMKADPRFKRIPVVVLSSSDASDDIRASYELQANCYLTKPMDLSEYYRMIQDLERFWNHGGPEEDESLGNYAVHSN